MATTSIKCIPANKANFYLYYTFFIFLILVQIQKINNEDCSKTSKISSSSSKTSCFNEIIKFQGSYRAGQFSIRNDGVLLVEYSSGGKRLFYGLDPNGRGHFNDKTNKIIEDMDNAYYWIEHKQYTTNVRYESKNRLVKLKDQISDSDKEYIFSVSSYHSLAELHDIDNNKFKTWLAADFLGVSEQWRYVFSFQFSLLHYNNSNTNVYYAAYVQYKGVQPDGKAYSESYSLSKFTFNSFTDRTVSYKEIMDNFDNRIVSAFIMPCYNKLMVFFFKTTTNSYTLGVHNLDTLKNEGNYKVNDLSGITFINTKGNGIFFKAIYLRFEYFAAIFYCNDDLKDGSCLKFRIYFVDKNYATSSKPAKHDWNNWGLNPTLTLNEFYNYDKDGEKFIFVSTQDSQKKLILFFIDTQEWYTKLSIRLYYFPLEGYCFKMDMALDYFNDFLMLASTLSIGSGCNDADPFYGTLFFFSYPNGTDFYINLSPYVRNSAYYQNGYNIIDYLISKRTIDNNIFHYTGIDEVKLISIPNEIIFYSSSSLSTRLTNGERIDKNGVLHEDKNLIKYDRNYTLDYQYMALDQESYTKLRTDAFEQVKIDNTISAVDDAKMNYTQKTYYGRVNRLYFRLCYYYCETCKELGNLESVNNQECLS